MPSRLPAESRTWAVGEVAKRNLAAITRAANRDATTCSPCGSAGMGVACGLKQGRPPMRLVVLAILFAAACRPPGYGREDKPDAAEDTGDGGPTADAAVDAAIPFCDHAFRLDGHGTATSVWMTGSFVTWAGTPQAGAVAFMLGNDSAWTGSYKFMAGTHQYKFVVNGNNWILDPTNPTTADDGMGNTNSVYTCVP